MQFDLVFEGGGAKGMVFVGAMEVFEQAGHESGRLLGTSAGAITATSLAAGYSSQELREALEETENGQSVFAQFLGEPQPFDEQEIRDSTIRTFLKELDLPFVPDFVETKLDDAVAHGLATRPGFRHLFSFVERGGWYSSAAFLKWLQRKLDEAYAKQVGAGTLAAQAHPFSAMSFEEFHAATGRELALVASDITAERMLVLNRHTAPQCPVLWAACMSMSVPLLWQEVVWQAQWGAYRGQDITGHAIVDGGLLSNFPIELFISDEKQVTDVMGAGRSQRVLGMLIDESLTVEGAPEKGAGTGASEIANLETVQRLRQLLNTATTAHDRAVIEAFENMVVRLPAKGYGTTEFDMSAARRDALVEAGRRAMRDHLDRQREMQPAGEAVSFGLPSPDAATGIANWRALKILDW